MKNKDLKRRIIELSYKHGLSHIGSCITAVDIIDEIYANKKPNEKFILSAGHAGLALYVVIEKYEGVNAEDILNHHGVHPDRCKKCHLVCSSGSLGNGLGIAVGMSLVAKENERNYCLVSDGEVAEGSIMEALRINWNYGKKTQVYINLNGYGAYGPVNQVFIRELLYVYTNFQRTVGYEYAHLDGIHFRNTSMDDYPEYLQGQLGHYKALNEEEFNEVMELLK